MIRHKNKHEMSPKITTINTYQESNVVGDLDEEEFFSYMMRSILK